MELEQDEVRMLQEKPGGGKDDFFWDELRGVPQFPQVKDTAPVGAVLHVAPLSGAKFLIPGDFPHVILGQHR